MKVNMLRKCAYMLDKKVCKVAKGEADLPNDVAESWLKQGICEAVSKKVAPVANKMLNPVEEVKEVKAKPAPKKKAPAKKSTKK